MHIGHRLQVADVANDCAEELMVAEKKSPKNW
jgi:hypothetical protein